MSFTDVEVRILSGPLVLRRMAKHCGFLQVLRRRISHLRPPAAPYMVQKPGAPHRPLWRSVRRSLEGSVSVLGHDPSNNERIFKQRIGIVLQKTGVEPYLNVEETIKLFAGYYRHPQPIQQILEITGLEKLRSIRVQKLSGGQLRRLDVAVGLVGNPELLFLDEPTTGFDPSARRSAWEMISNLRTLGKTVFLTTHYMEEAEYLADRVAIMVNGKIVAEGTPHMQNGANYRSMKFDKFFTFGTSLPDGGPSASCPSCCIRAL